mgnify:CR=1 FL=1
MGGSVADHRHTLPGMPGPAAAVIAQFGAIEDGQRYGRLAELFTDDAVYYDPLAGPQRGTVAIAEFMARLAADVASHA